MNTLKVIKLPPLSDARWFFLVFAIVNITFALSSSSYNRVFLQFFVSVFTCSCLDFLLALLLRRQLLFPMSGALSSMGVFLLCDSPYIWPFVFASSLAILSKHVLQINGKHYFNPNNFGLVSGFFLIPEYMTLSAGRWGADLTINLIVASMGFILAVKAKRIAVTISYVIIFTLGAYLRSNLSGVAFFTTLGPLFGASFLLFIFFHFTDPKTSPPTIRNQIVYGVSVGVLDAIFRLNQIKFAPFYSVFLICLGLFLTALFNQRKNVVNAYVNN